MKKTGLVLLLASIGLAGVGQISHAQAQAQPAAAQPMPIKTNRLSLGSAPTDADMYCAGFITRDKVPETRFLAAGAESPDQTRYASDLHPLFITGKDMNVGERYMIVRHAKDPNPYEGFKGQRGAVRDAGEIYFERGFVRVAEVQKDIAIAIPEMSCHDFQPGDLAIPFAERKAPRFRDVKLERFTPPNGNATGRIILADGFETYLGTRSKVYLNIGEDKGLKEGDYLRATRTYSYVYADADEGLARQATYQENTQKNPPQFKDIARLPRLTVGDMIVLRVEKKSATAMILTALQPLKVGDSVEIMDASAAPELQPLRMPTTELNPGNAATPEADISNLPRIACTASPTSVRPGERSTISCDASSPDNRPLTVTFVSNGGHITSSGKQATLDTTDAGAGPISVRATAADDRQLSTTAVATVNVEAPPTAATTARKLNDLDFKPSSAYVDNRSKAMLDDVALKLQQDPTSTAVLYGQSDEKEPSRLAMQRAENTKTYLTKSKGIDPQRIQTKAATEPGHGVEIWTLPAGVAPPK